LWPEDAEKEIESIMMLFRSVKSALLQGTTQQSSKLLMDKNPPRSHPDPKWPNQLYLFPNQLYFSSPPNP